MSDEFFTRTPAPIDSRRGIGARGLLAAAAIAFVAGAAGVGYIAWAGLFPFEEQHPARLAAGTTLPAPSPGHTAPSPAPAAAPSGAVGPALPSAVGAIDTRVAALEQRLTQLDLRAEAASGNAARAEGLLVAFAGRRALDRGAPLGYLEDQLRLRFADAQPNAVNTVVGAGRKPVTLDQLLEGLDGLGPKLASAPSTESGWDRFRFELSSLFVIRRSSAPSANPASRLERARANLLAGKVDAAIDEVRAMPGSGAASDWLAQARRYSEVRAALDLIETTALIGTGSLKDSAGKPVDQPSVAGSPDAP